jgi:hypothetical protein
MGLLSQIDMAFQKDLVDFIKAQEEKPWPHTLGDTLLVEILKDIVKCDARLSGCATNHEKKRMYLEISFYENNEEAEPEECQGGQEDADIRANS